MIQKRILYEYDLPKKILIILRCPDIKNGKITYKNLLGVF